MESSHKYRRGNTDRPNTTHYLAIARVRFGQPQAMLAQRRPLIRSVAKELPGRMLPF
jgi:hypothetical protein